MKLTTPLASLAFLAVAAMSGAASASIYNIATPVDQALYLSFTAPALGPFSDIYNFTVSTLSDLAGSVTNHQLQFGTTDILNINSLNMSVYNAANVLLSSSGSGVSVLDTNIAAGAYHALVTGTGTGTLGGAYMVSIIAQPVPVPAAVWLLGSGLIGIIGVARRKEPT